MVPKAITHNGAVYATAPDHVVKKPRDELIKDLTADAASLRGNIAGNIARSIKVGDFKDALDRVRYLRTTFLDIMEEQLNAVINASL